MTAPKRKPVFTLLSIDQLDHGYSKISELPDMIETVIEDDSLRFLKLGFQLDVQPITHFGGPEARRIREQLQRAMAERLMDVLPAEYEALTGSKIIVGADMAAAMAERLYRRGCRGTSSELSTTPDGVYRGRVILKAGVDLIFSPDSHHIALRANNDMAGGEARFGGEVVYWRLRSCVGDVTNYFDDVEFRRMWLEDVQKACPYVKLDTAGFKVYR